MDQLEVVESALRLERSIAALSERVQEIRGEAFRAAPPEPQRRTVEREYPTVESAMKHDRTKELGLLAAALVLSFVRTFFYEALQEMGIEGPMSALFLILWFGGIAQFFRERSKFKKAKAADEERIRESAEYRRLCAPLDERYDREQVELDARYEADHGKWENEAMPRYRREKQEWEACRAERLEEASGALRSDSDALEALYRDSRVVPEQYRSIPALEHIHRTMSTSSFDIAQAIEAYDRERQMEIERRRLEAQWEANDIAAEGNEIASRRLREQRIQEAVRFAQHHRTNKTLGDIAKKGK